jgi:hypothetical protein
MSNCTHLDSTLISKAILEQLWNFEIMNATVLFLKSNKHGRHDLQQKHNTFITRHVRETTQLVSREFVQMRTRKRNCLMKVFTVRDMSDFWRSEIFRGYFDKIFMDAQLM